MISEGIFNDYGSYLRSVFPDFKVQKLSVNVGLTCPNRDGSKGRGGCTYCINSSFSPSYVGKGGVAEQLEAGKRFFGRKYPNMKYLAYFQSYTNTYSSLDHLVALYEEALATPDVVGLVVATRPDCVDEEVLDYLAEINQRTFVAIEYGVESTLDKTLESVHRGHTFAEAEKAIYATTARGITVGAHLIIGLPGEAYSDFELHIDRLASLPITTLKMHQLQILKGTIMAHQYRSNPETFSLFTPEEYVDVICRLLRRLPRRIYLDRFVSQSPPELLMAPKWGWKNYQFVHLIERRMRENGWQQGDLFL